MSTRASFVVVSAAGLLLAGLSVSATGVAAPREGSRRSEPSTRSSSRRGVKKTAVRFDGKRKTLQGGALPFDEMVETKPPTNAPTSKSDLAKPAVTPTVTGPVAPASTPQDDTYQWHSPAKLAAPGRVQIVSVPALSKWSPTGIQTKGMMELKVTPPAGKSILLACGVQEASGPSSTKAIYEIEPLAPMKSLSGSAGVLELVVSNPTTLKISKHPSSPAKGTWQLNGCETTLK